jgi:formylglycine-generating enzyme required for sulfatase activity
MDLVKAGMESEELAKRVQQRGIDFDLTDDYLQTLRQAGAQDALIKALRAVKPKPMTREQVLQLLVGGVPSPRAAALVKQRGIDFLPDAEYLETLRVAGAEERLLAALRAAGEAATGQIRLNPKDGLKYVWIPPGTFIMGCSPGDSKCYDDEKPPHRVTISKGFWMGQTEVTVEAYSRFVNQTGRQMPPARDSNPGWTNRSMPIENVSWDDAHAYCEWAGGRLPTEAEWEYAARGGSLEAFYSNLDDIAWYVDNSGDSDIPRSWREDENRYLRGLSSTHRAQTVGQKQPNGFRLFDMLGNVWEWVNDWYGSGYYQNSPAIDPQGPAGGETRVVRGGAWYNGPKRVRASFRLRLEPGSRTSDLFGFRCGGEVGGP